MVGNSSKWRTDTRHNSHSHTFFNRPWKRAVYLSMVTFFKFGSWGFFLLFHRASNKSKFMQFDKILEGGHGIRTIVILIRYKLLESQFSETITYLTVLFLWKSLAQILLSSNHDVVFYILVTWQRVISGGDFILQPCDLFQPISALSQRNSKAVKGFSIAS